MLLMDFEVGWVIFLCFSRPLHWCIVMAALRSPWMKLTRSFIWCLPTELTLLRALAAVSFEIKPDQSGSVHIFIISVRTTALNVCDTQSVIFLIFSLPSLSLIRRDSFLSPSPGHNFFELVVLSASVDISILRGTKTWFVRVERIRLWWNCCLCGDVFWRLYEGCHFVFNS